MIEDAVGNGRMKKQMKNNMFNKLKKTMVIGIMACMLLTVVNVSSDAINGIVAYGEKIIEDHRDLG